MIAIHRRGSTPTSDSPVVVAGMITRTLEGLRLELRARPGAELVITEDDARALVRTGENAPIYKAVNVGRVQVTEEIGSMYGSPCTFWYRSPRSRGIYIHVMSGLPRLPLLFASMEDVREVYQGLRCMAVVGYPRPRTEEAGILEGDTRTIFWRDQDGQPWFARGKPIECPDGRRGFLTVGNTRIVSEYRDARPPSWPEGWYLMARVGADHPYIHDYLGPLAHADPDLDPCIPRPSPREEALMRQGISWDIDLRYWPDPDEFETFWTWHTDQQRVTPPEDGPPRRRNHTTIEDLRS